MLFPALSRVNPRACNSVALPLWVTDHRSVFGKFPFIQLVYFAMHVYITEAWNKKLGGCVDS